MIRSLDFVTVETLASKRAREALAVVVEFTKSKVTGRNHSCLTRAKMSLCCLSLSEWLSSSSRVKNGPRAFDTVYPPFPSGTAFNQAKAQLVEAWPPLTKNVEIRRPMVEGFGANLDYFRLDFLDRSLVESGGKLADLLPALWMMAACREQGAYLHRPGRYVAPQGLLIRCVGAGICL